MARGRPRRTVQTETKKGTVNNTVTVVSQDNKVDEVIIPDQSEIPQIGTSVQNDTPSESVQSKEVNDDLPKLDSENNNENPSTESFVDNSSVEEKPLSVMVKRSDEVIQEEKKIEITKTTKDLEYPPSVVSIIKKLKKNPSYARLTDSALLRIASSKLRSRYFFV